MTGVGAGESTPFTEMSWPWVATGSSAASAQAAVASRPATLPPGPGVWTVSAMPPLRGRMRLTPVTSACSWVAGVSAVRFATGTIESTVSGREGPLRPPGSAAGSRRRDRLGRRAEHRHRDPRCRRRLRRYRRQRRQGRLPAGRRDRLRAVRPGCPGGERSGRGRAAAGPTPAPRRGRMTRQARGRGACGPSAAERKKARCRGPHSPFHRAGRPPPRRFAATGQAISSS